MLNSAAQLQHEAYRVAVSVEDSEKGVNQMFDHMGKMYDSNKCYSAREFDFVEREIRTLSDDLAVFAEKVAKPTWLQRRQAAPS